MIWLIFGYSKHRAYQKLWRRHILEKQWNKRSSNNSSSNSNKSSGGEGRSSNIYGNHVTIANDDSNDNAIDNNGDGTDHTVDKEYYN